MLKKILNFLKLSKIQKDDESVQLVKDINISLVTELKIDDEIVSSSLDSKISIIQAFNNDFNDRESISKLESWLVENYFNNSDSLVEKKYKMVVLSLVFEQKNIYLSKMPILEKIIKDFSIELINNKETSINLNDIFNKDPEYQYIYLQIMLASKCHEFINITGTELIKKILCEDNANLEKLAIGKNVYEQFSFLGLLANTFIKANSNMDILAEFQDYKFTNFDINIFKNFIKKVTDTKYDGYHYVKLPLRKWEVLIKNEFNLDNLNIFKELYLHSDGNQSYGLSFSSMLFNSQDNREEDKDYLIEFLEKRIEYLEMGNSLEKSSEIHNKQIKKAKL